MLHNNKYHNKGDKQILFDAYYYFKKEIYNPHPEQKEIKRTPTSYYQGYGNVIDYIFISNDLKDKVLSYEVFDKHLKENQNGSLLKSDHAPVVCELNLSNC